MGKKVILTGIRSYGCLRLAGFKRAGVKVKKIPAFCYVEIDISKIKPRKKGENGTR